MKLKMKGGSCPPGTFCIENLTLLFLVLVLCIGAYCLYLSMKSSSALTPYSHELSHNTGIIHHHNNLGPHLHSLANMKDHLMFNISSNSSGYDMLRPLADPKISVSSDPKDTLLNPYAPPVHVNQPHAYKQIGYLKNDSHGHVMFPLFAKPQHLRRDKWYYYTIYNNIKLPVYSKGRKCSSEHGCDSLYSGDQVTLENLPGNFEVSTYDNETLVYDPVI